MTVDLSMALNLTDFENVCKACPCLHVYGLFVSCVADNSVDEDMARQMSEVSMEEDWNF